MLILNLKALLESRGFDKPQRQLTLNGFNNFTASRLMNNRATTISFTNLEKLCLACQCTLDELFVWVPDEAKPVAADHPIQKLKAKPKAMNPVDRIRQLGPDKLKVLQEFMDGLEKK